MDCNPELLHAFLDHELDTDTANKLKKHLARCRACRQELSQLKLVWLELAQSEEVAVPLELPYLRQQVIEAARTSHKKTEGGKFSFWGAQRLAWQSLDLATAYLPGYGRFKEITKSASREVPGFLLGSLTAMGGLCRQIYLKKKGSGTR